MPNDPVLHLIGLARKAGKLELGEEPVGASCRAGQAKLILLASDAAPNTCRRAAHFAQSGSVLFLQVPFTKAELGGQVGRSSCAMVALTDFGFAATLTEKLAARDPEHFTPAAQQLRVKADKVYQRQKEQRQHEKNVQRGKVKPWAPPPKPPAQTAKSPKGKAPDGQSPKGQPFKGKAPSGQSPKGQPFKGKAPNRQPPKGKPFNGKAPAYKSKSQAPKFGAHTPRPNQRVPEEAAPPRRPNGPDRSRRSPSESAAPKNGAPRSAFPKKTGGRRMTVKSGPIQKK